MVKIRLSGIHAPPVGQQSPPNEEEKKIPKIKVKTASGTTLPRIRVKTRKPGDGYDSEAPDREDDPMSEEAIILRMIPGKHLDILRNAVDCGDFNAINIKFKDSRRAVVTVGGQLFAAKLVDLPTITETFKTFDKKNIYKSSDVCQMLLVTQTIEKEQDVLSVVKDANVHWPHGITPPLHNVAKTRFRKRVSNKVIETVEAKVDELFRLDDEAEESQYELLNPALLELERSDSASPMPMDEEEEEEEEAEEEFEVGDVLGQELEKALVESEDESEDEDEDSDEDIDEDMDEDEREEIHHIKLLNDEVKELEATIAAKQRDADNTVNQIMKGRLLEVVGKLRQELEMKRRQLPTESKSDKTEEQGATLDINGEAAEDEEEDDDDLDALF